LYPAAEIKIYLRRPDSRVLQKVGYCNSIGMLTQKKSIAIGIAILFVNIANNPVYDQSLQCNKLKYRSFHITQCVAWCPFWTHKCCKMPFSSKLLNGSC